MRQHQSEEEITVLIVEDDIRIAEINRRFVEKIKGYRVIGIATDEQQATEQLTILQPDLVLLDIYFPDMNGLDFLQRIHKCHPDTDVIMITAAKEVETVKASIRSGVFDFIIKPLMFERFKQTLENYQEFRQKLRKIENEKQDMNQEEIDELIRGSRKEQQPTSYLPKGIDKLTLEKVIAVMKQQENGITAEEVGKKIGVSRPTARRYLEYLIAKGTIAADLSYGEVGRPERIYKRVEKE